MHREHPFRCFCQRRGQHKNSTALPDAEAAAQNEQALILMQRMRRAQFYPEWEKYAAELDLILNVSIWKEAKESTYYDVRLIEETLSQLRQARASKNHLRLLQLLKSGLLRNFGGVNDPRLYTVSPLGTKSLIEAYHSESISSIHDLAEHTALAIANSSVHQLSIPSPLVSPTNLSPIAISPSHFEHPPFAIKNKTEESKKNENTYVSLSRPIGRHLKWLSDIKQSFGHTALFFQGGSTLGTL